MAQPNPRQGDASACIRRHQATPLPPVMSLPRYRITFNSIHYEGQMQIVGRTVPSSDVDASRVPSGLHAHESTM
jgi:hypothetical protein